MWLVLYSNNVMHKLNQIIKTHIKIKFNQKEKEKEHKKNIKENGTFFLFWLTNSFTNFFSYNTHIMR